MASLPWDLTSYQLAVLPRRCTECDAPLTESARMLELDGRDRTFHDRRDIPEDKSQGWFPFCLDCATKASNSGTGCAPARPIGS